MVKPFFSSKWWEWMILLVCALVLGAIFFPVRAYSGPSPRGVARNLAGLRQETGAWPPTGADRASRFTYVLERAEPEAAVYRIEEGRAPETWNVRKTGKAYRIDGD